MKFNMVEELNPICEILGLIYESKNHEILMKKYIEELDRNGINGEVFAKKNLKVLDKYVKEFKKNMIFEDENDFFLYEDDEDTTIFLVIMAAIIYQEEYQSFKTMSDEEIRNLILDAYYEMSEEDNIGKDLNSLDDILKFIEKQDMSDKNKWKFMKLLSSPKKSINPIVKAIEDNKYAYEEAYKSLESQIIKLISKTKKYVDSGECEVINNITSKDGIFTLLPTLAFSAAIFEFKNTVYMGLLTETIFKAQVKAIGNKGNLVLKLKALSDNSKLEALSLLKMGPKYSLEIAESLKLTPATVSYHMSTLLEIGLVSVEKKQGKVYYCLNKESMQKLIDDLSNTLL